MDSLPPDYLAALQAYAAFHGRRWKEALRIDWYHAMERSRLPPETRSALQAIRNDPRFGPGWLEKFKLPK